MPRSIPAHPTPSVLRWARERQGLSLEAAASKIGRPEQELAAWEAGTHQPTVSQLRKAAQTYKRALAVFYLPEPPSDFEAMPDFRTLPDGADRAYSSELLWIIRAAHDRQEWVRSLHEQDELEPLSFVGSCAGAQRRGPIVDAIRNAIVLPTRQALAARRTADEALSLWTNAVEEAGIFVFQTGDVAPSEARGFALVDQFAPFIFLNSKDPRSARIFTLIHEVAHVMLGESGISNLETQFGQDNRSANIERLCNSVAGEILTPENDLRRDISPTEGFEELRKEISRLATRYRVGKEVIARRLFEFGYISKPAFQNMRQHFLDEWKERQERQQSGAIPFALTVVQSRGRKFSREVFNEYSNGNLNTRDVSALLNVRVKHFSRILERVAS